MTTTDAIVTVVSDRKRAANQANALKSTGPRSAEGKAKVRFNAVIHGLRAETVVLPHEDADEFEAMRQGWIEDWKPQTETRLALVERAVAGAWRLRRCVKVEHDRLTKQIETAVNAYDRRVNVRVDEGLRILKLDPARGLAELKHEYAGVAALIARWEFLGESVVDPRRWSTVAHHKSLLNLLGFASYAKADDVGSVALHSWRLMVWNDPAIGESEIEVADEDEANEIAAALAECIAEKIVDLQNELSRYPDPDLVRARVADSVAYDVSREGLAIQRYEGQLDRSFRANLNQLTRLAQTGADLIEAEMVEQAEPTNKATESPAASTNKATESPTEATNEPIETPAAPEFTNKATKLSPYVANERLAVPLAHVVGMVQVSGY